MKTTKLLLGTAFFFIVTGSVMADGRHHDSDGVALAAQIVGLVRNVVAPPPTVVVQSRPVVIQRPPPAVVVESSPVVIQRPPVIVEPRPIVVSPWQPKVYEEPSVIYYRTPTVIYREPIRYYYRPGPGHRPYYNGRDYGRPGSRPDGRR